MNALVHGFTTFCRRRKTSLMLIAVTLVVSLAFVFSQITLGVFEIYKARNENPYSDYYRLLVDRRTDTVHKGYESTDRMLCGFWSGIKKINDYFLDITDYTAEITGTAAADIDPVMKPWVADPGSFTLYGITECFELPEFTRGEITLTAGRYITAADREKKNDVCMINDTIAQLYGIETGGTVSFEMADGSFAPFSVVGIYRDEVAHDTSEIQFSYDLPENRVFVPLSAFEKARPYYCYNYQIKLSDESLIDEVEDLVNKYGMCAGYPAYFIRVSEISGASNRGVGAIQQALSIVQTVFIAVSAVLMFIFIYSLTVSRKRDIGILLALGGSRANIAATLLAEFCISVFVGIAIAGIISATAGESFSAWVLRGLEKTATAESLRITTSDTLRLAAHEADALASLTGGSFIRSRFSKALLLTLPTALSGVAAALCGVFGMNVMKLLTKREQE